MYCETCNKIHNGKDGSGRFCSQKCSRRFATLYKRQEINEKVSKKLKNKTTISVFEDGEESVCGTFEARPYAKVGKLKDVCGRGCRLELMDPHGNRWAVDVVVDCGNFSDKNKGVVR